MKNIEHNDYPEVNNENLGSVKYFGKSQIENKSGNFQRILEVLDWYFGDNKYLAINTNTSNKHLVPSAYGDVKADGLLFDCYSHTDHVPLSTHFYQNRYAISHLVISHIKTTIASLIALLFDSLNP